MFQEIQELNRKGEEGGKNRDLKWMRKINEELEEIYEQIGIELLRYLMV